MPITPHMNDEVLRGGKDRVFYVNGTFAPESQLCQNTDWAEIKWLQKTRDKTSTKGPEVAV